MLKGFKDFILRGNVVELATAVIIGAAFTAIVTAFTDKIIAPLLASIPTGRDCGQTMAVADGKTQSAAVQVCGLDWRIIESNPATTIDFGAVIAAGINFLIVAAVVYFLIIVPYNKISELSSLNKAEEAEATEIDLLGEIRDLLAQPRPAAAPAAPAAPSYQQTAPTTVTYANPTDGPRHGR